MDFNTLTSKQDLYHLHNTTEGNNQRVMTLLLLTNKKGAYQVLNQNRFPRDTREFGAGHYFVETLDESEYFDIEERAVVACQVEVGVSLILTYPDPNITQKFLKSKNCSSLKGFLNSTQKYYVIYNYKQISKVLALKAEQSVVRPYETYKCTNYLCKFHGQYHHEECPLKCLEKNCRFFNGFHVPPCHLKCLNKLCEMFDSFHELNCKNRCTWENCVMLGKYHEGKCIHLDHESEVQEVFYNKVRFDTLIEKKSGKRKKGGLKNPPVQQIVNPSNPSTIKANPAQLSLSNPSKQRQKINPIPNQDYYSQYPSLIKTDSIKAGQQKKISEKLSEPLIKPWESSKIKNNQTTDIFNYPSSSPAMPVNRPSQQFIPSPYTSKDLQRNSGAPQVLNYSKPQPITKEAPRPKAFEEQALDTIHITSNSNQRINQPYIQVRNRACDVKSLCAGVIACGIVIGICFYIMVRLKVIK